MYQWQAQAISISIESVVIIGLIYFRQWHVKQKFLNLLMVGIAATLLTHPIAWFFNEQLFFAGINFTWRALGIETLIVIIEGIAISYALDFNFSRALFLSALANIASFGLGLLILSV